MYEKLFTGYPIQILSSFIVTIGIFSFGLGHLWIAPAIPKLLSNNETNNEDTIFNITDSEGSWIASIELITLPISSFGTIFLANYFGTKNILMVAPFPLVFSWILIYFAQNVWYFYSARVLVGISEAFFYNCAPVYISEISDPKIRGALLFLIPVFFNIGSLITYYFGYILSIKLFAFLSIIPAIVYFILFISMPQSPYFFIIQKKYDKAEEILRLLRGKDYNENEIEILKEAIQFDMLNKVTIKTLLNNYSYRKSFGIVFMIMGFQQLCGTTTIASYLHLVINESNLNMNTEIPAVIIGIVTILSSMCSTFWIDRKGRRPLLLVSIFGAGVSILIGGVYFALMEHNFDLINYKWIPTVVLIFYELFVNFGIINMSLVLAGELFSTNTKNYGIGAALISYGTFGFITNKIFQLITNNFGMSYNFFGFSFFAFIGFICFYLYLPETRQKSLIEIQTMLQQKKKSVPL